MVDVVERELSDRKAEKLFDLNAIPDEEVEDPKEEAVVVEDDGSAPIEAVAEEEPHEERYAPHRKKKRPTPDQRISKYAHKAKTYESAANLLFEENKALKDRYEKAEREKQAYIEHALQLKADYAREIYEKAAEEGDVEKQAEAQTYMTKFNTELTLMKNRDTQNYSHDEEPENLNEFLSHIPVPQTNSYAEEWLHENEWADRNSEYYDPEMAYEAMVISTGMDRELRRSRQAHLIGTPVYCETIADAVKEKFGIQDGEDEYEDREEPQERSVAPRQTVAPVSRSSGGHMNAAPTPGPRTVVLSPQEKNMALRMDYGVNLTNQEKIKRWADSKYKLMKNGKL